MNKKKLIVVLLSALFALGSLAFGMVYSKRYNDRIKQEAQETTQSSTTEDNKKEETKKTNVADLFADEGHIFLAKDISDKLLTSVKNSVKGNAEQEVLVKQAESKWKILKQVNQLFESSVLKGKEVQETSLKSDVTAADLDRVVGIVESDLATDAFQEKLLSIIEETRQNGSLIADEATDDDNAQAIDSAGLDFSQSTEVANARERVGYIVNEGIVEANFTMESYQNARAAVDVLSESDEKAYLNQQLRYVEEAMTNMGIEF